MATFRKRQARGKTVYDVQIRRKGFPSLNATFERLTDAKAWAARQEVAISEARAVPGRAARQHTVADLIERYLEIVLPQKRPSTMLTQRQQLLWWKAQIGHLRLCDVTPALFAEQRDLLARLLAPATVIRYLAVLSHAFTVGIREWQWLDENPLRRITKPKEPRGRVRFLDEEERGRLLDACRTSTSTHLYLVVLLALSTGARKQEILALRWADVDLTRGHITFHDTKNKHRRSVPLAGIALERMRQHTKGRRLDTTLVFPRADGRAPLDMRSAWETALRHAHIADFRFHDLRHSAASYLAMNGASLAEIADILGHKTLAMVQRYAHLSEQHTARIVAKMNAAVFGTALADEEG